jgi:hypothetical protein
VVRCFVGEAVRVRELLDRRLVGRVRDPLSAFRVRVVRDRRDVVARCDLRVDRVVAPAA